MITSRSSPRRAHAIRRRRKARGNQLPIGPSSTNAARLTHATPLGHGARNDRGHRRGPAQPAQPTAATLLANVQQFYVNVSHLTAQFRQVITNATFNTTKTSDGTLWVAKPTRFRCDYLKKKQNSVTSGGDPVTSQARG